MVTSATEQYVQIGNDNIKLTSLDKLLWPEKNLTKADYLVYLKTVSPFSLPFLKNRLLTVIRYPHGVSGESFYQKNCPEYAPAFVDTYLEGDINYIVCNHLQAYLWLGNQLAFEFHVPFQTIGSKGPSEIVFDLDPPSRKKFQLAIEAALMIKDICDRLKLQAFVKTSGNKGLQIYIPLPENHFTYEETRTFTRFVADYLIEKEPNHFTIERLKKHRGNKLYIDYLQHAEGKTIIAPYSVRGNAEALVATPIDWHEVTRFISPDQFPMETVLERVKKRNCPFDSYFTAKNGQPFQSVIDWLLEKR